MFICHFSTLHAFRKKMIDLASNLRMFGVGSLASVWSPLIGIEKLAALFPVIDISMSATLVPANKHDVTGTA